MTMPDVMIHTVPGLFTNPDGDMLGLKDFNDTMKENFPGLEWYAKGWDEIQPCDFIQRWGTKFNILICHSYGGAACKRVLDNKASKNLLFNLSIYLDPVPRWLWGQFAINWNAPKQSIMTHEYYQKNLPPCGMPFKPRPNISQWDVSNWERKLYHADIPGSITIQRRMGMAISDLLTKGSV